MPYGKQGGTYPKRSSGGYGRKDNDRGRGKLGKPRPSFDRVGRDSRGPKQMFDAVCGSCGNDCKIPFRPSGSRPVLCSNCFDKKGGREKFDGGTRPRVDRSMDRPFKKDYSSPKPDRRIDTLQETLDQVLARLDRLARLVEGLQMLSVSKQKVLSVPNAEEAPVKAKKTTKKPAGKKVTKKTAPKKSITKKSASKKKK